MGGCDLEPVSADPAMLTPLPLIYQPRDWENYNYPVSGPPLQYPKAEDRAGAGNKNLNAQKMLKG